MPSGLEDRNCRWREGRLGECADRNGNNIWRCRKRVEDRRAAVGAEMKGSLLALVGSSHVLAVATDDVHSIRCEPCLDPEGASSPTLAGKAVAHGDPDRIALRCQTKLPTATHSIAGSHRRGSYWLRSGSPGRPLRRGRPRSHGHFFSLRQMSAGHWLALRQLRDRTFLPAFEIDAERLRAIGLLLPSFIV